MRRLAVFAAAALAAVFLPIASVGAGVPADGARVTFVNAYSYQASSNFSMTLCVDGEVVDPALDTEDITAPLTLPAGSYDVEFFYPTQADCTGTAYASATLSLASDDDVTAVVWWSPSAPTHAITVFSNDTSCLPSGESRFTVRHVATTPPFGVLGTPSGGSEVPLFDLIDPGTQQSGDTAPLTLTDVKAVVPGPPPDELVTVPEVDLAAGKAVTMYVFAGDDGAVGAFTQVTALTTCATPTTVVPTTVAPTSVVTLPITVQPAFTG